MIQTIQHPDIGDIRVPGKTRINSEWFCILKFSVLLVLNAHVVFVNKTNQNRYTIYDLSL